MIHLRPLALCIALALPVSAQAEDAPAADPPAESMPFLDLFEQMLRGFMHDVEPQMRELKRGFESLEPELERFLSQFRGMVQYHPPEILPNGDILIRRRQSGEEPGEDSSPDAADEPAAEEPFEL